MRDVFILYAFLFTTHSAAAWAAGDPRYGGATAKLQPGRTRSMTIRRHRFRIVTLQSRLLFTPH
jgi:hypothetical protein